MKWEHFWDTQATSSDQAQQVGRISRHGKSLPLTELANYIVQKIDLNPNDKLLDVCCGNGALSWLLAQNVGEFTGVDLSAKQIERARQMYPEGNWQQLAAENLGALNKRYNKITLNFSFQYFTSNRQAMAVLRAMRLCASDDAQLLITDIPDVNFWHLYYPNTKSRLRWLFQKLTGKESMGKFWQQQKLAELCQKAGFEAVFIQQPDHFPYAWYRFDCLLRPLKS